MRIGGPDAAWRPCTAESLKDVVPDLPFALVERVMPPRDADAVSYTHLTLPTILRV